MRTTDQSATIAERAHAAMHRAATIAAGTTGALTIGVLTAAGFAPLFGGVTAAALGLSNNAALPDTAEMAVTHHELIIEALDI